MNASFGKRFWILDRGFWIGRQRSRLRQAMCRAVLIIASGALMYTSLGCGASRRDAPLSEPLAIENPQVARGQIVFMQNCYQCHPGGGAGLGPALNNKPAPKFLIRTQVRKGLGAMPAFDEARISDDDLEALAMYTVTLRRTGE